MLIKQILGTYRLSGGKSFGFVSEGLSKVNSLTAVSGSFKGVKNVPLKLKGNVLSGGVHYRFKLNVVDIGGIKASAVYDIRTNSVPNTGRIDCS